MSLPIEIPPNESRRRRQLLDREIFPERDGPYFGYIEVFEGNRVYRGISTGSGKFVEVNTRCRLPRLSFIVEKDRRTRRITLDLVSKSLEQIVYSTIFNDAPRSAPSEADFDIILKHYDVLRGSLRRLRDRNPYDEATMEMRLLVGDLLVDRALFDGMGMRIIRQQQKLSRTHLKDIYANHINTGLDDFERCFSLGLTPDDKESEYLQGLNKRYAELARLGDLPELRNLCEPRLRSGDFRFFYNPSLLLDVLGNGHVDVFQYMLDLIDRTKQSYAETVDSLQDVTFDPLYVAIKLGNLGAVRWFIQEHATFEGYVVDDDLPNPDCIFTPVAAAVYWRRADILRLLLATAKDSIYHAGLPGAMAMVLAQEPSEIQQVLGESQLQPLANTPRNDNGLSREYSKHQISMAYPNLRRSGAIPEQALASMGKSISGISNALNYSASTPSTSFVPMTLVDHPLPGPVQHKSGYRLTQPPTIRAELKPAYNPLGMTTPKSVGDDMENPTFPFIRRTSIHKTRRELGRGFRQRLEGRCEEVVRICDACHRLQVSTALGAEFRSSGKVWKSGVKTFRRVTLNHAPSGLLEFLQALVVADALVDKASGSKNGLQEQFINDLGRWRTLLNFTEQSVFDQVACSIWNIKAMPIFDTSECWEAGLIRFQALIQDVVSLDDLADQALFKSDSSGAPLLLIHKQVKAQQQQMAQPELAPNKFILPDNNSGEIDSVSGKLTRDTDDNEKRLLAEPIDLEAWEGASRGCTNRALARSGAPFSEEGVNVRVVLLLGSVAFSAVLTAVSAIQEGSDDLHAQAFWTESPGYHRSCALVEKCLSFNEDEASGSSFYDSGIDVETPREVDQSPWISEMREASKTNSTLRSLNIMGESTPSYLQTATPGSVSSPSASPYIVTDASSPETDRTITGRPQCSLCLKTFSSISNRNKHTREGCKMRNRVQYPCGIEGCTKNLSTKWYRDKHEEAHYREKSEESRTRNRGNLFDSSSKPRVPEDSVG